MTRYRLVVFGRPRRWRSTKREAQQEAVNADLAHWCEEVPGRCYLGPGVEIEGKEQIRSRSIHQPTCAGK